YWGNNSSRFKRPLAVYGLMEIGIAATALLWIPGIEFYKDHYASFLTLLGDNRSLLTISKFIFSTSLLFLPTVLMGGTFPILAQYIGNGNTKFASRATVLYAINTLGAASGVFLAGFLLLIEYGVSSTYSIAIFLALSIGALAIILDWFKPKQYGSENIEVQESSQNKDIPFSSPSLTYSQFILIAFSSGLLALSAETIWTRMFAQVLQNSVYSFSAILVVFLIALGVGGLLSHVLVRIGLPIIPVLLTLLSLSAVLVGISPMIFSSLTNGLNYLASESSWGDYLRAIFKLSFLVVFVPTVILGAIFPFLLKASPKINLTPGKFVGKLVLFNSLGGTIGPIIAGFLLLDLIGLWNTIKIIAILYGVIAFIIAFTSSNKRKFQLMLIPIAAIAGVITLANPPIVQLEPDEKILNTWQSSDGVLTIVESGGNIQMRLDNFYTLGDSKSTLVEQMQGHIPLLIHPSPKQTLFLGMGTGITAGASLSHKVEQVEVVELVANVVPAAQQYFSLWTNGLFKDKRVNIIADDARNYLLGTEKKFDVIVGDLFTPWHAGTGSLYTVEHFKQVKSKLSEGGIFAQWLPMYQLTPESFNIIAATFSSVFPEVTVWRADFSSSGASIALIGQEKGSVLNQKVLEKNIVNVVGNSRGADHMAGLFYLGNLKAIKNRLSSIELNTDDRRTVEFKAPILSHQASVGGETFIVGNELESLLSSLAKRLPVNQDPYLINLPTNELKYVEVGLLYFRYQKLIVDKKIQEADSVLKQINVIAPSFLNKP
ncbi:MAG: fused MFS/spermidine synthase, partial [Cyclobacteriaceae bacterium]|nr:fused MFS/spermidine synthase [Cyclobacteriaceae bacterium]